MPIKRYRILLFFLFLCIIIKQTHPADYANIYGIHGRYAAMGNAAVSLVNNSSAAFYNPAGLARSSNANFLLRQVYKDEDEYRTRLKKHQDKYILTYGRPSLYQDIQKVDKKDIIGKNGIDYKVLNQFEYAVEIFLNYGITIPLLKHTVPSRHVSQDITLVSDNFISLGMGFHLNNFVKIIDNHIKFGLVVSLPATGSLITINDINPSSLQYLTTGRSNLRPNINAALGIEIIKDYVYYGLGASVLFDGGGSFLLKDIPVSPNQIVPNQQIILDLKPRLYVSTGFIFKYNILAIGASYRQKSQLQIEELIARAVIPIAGANGIEINARVGILTLISPSTYAAGFSLTLKDGKFDIDNRFLRDMTLSYEITHERWSEFTHSAEKLIFLEPYNLININVHKVGVEYGFEETIFIRMGYANRDTPVTDETLKKNINVLDSERNIITAGLGFQIPSALVVRTPILFDIAFQYHMFKERSVVKNNQSADLKSFKFGGKIALITFTVGFFF